MNKCGMTTNGKPPSSCGKDHGCMLEMTCKTFKKLKDIDLPICMAKCTVKDVCSGRDRSCPKYIKLYLIKNKVD